MLVIEVGKKYNDRTLRSVRQLYTMVNDEIWKPLVSKLSWTTFLILMPLKDNGKIYYYANQCLINNLSKRQLQNKNKSKEYERLDNQTKNKLTSQEQATVSDFIKNPILIKNSYNYKEVSEKALKRLILEDVEEDKTIGIIILKQENKYVIKYCSDKRIVAREYKLV